MLCSHASAAAFRERHSFWLQRLSEKPVLMAREIQPSDVVMLYFHTWIPYIFPCHLMFRRPKRKFVIVLVYPFPQFDQSLFQYFPARHIAYPDESREGRDLISEAQ